MTQEKKSPNPFINLASAAKAAAAGSRVSPAKAAQVQNAKYKQTGVAPKPIKKSTGRGR